ncbi:MAG: autotransporter outer membrane beta-barrel domain-containing protein [Desulfobacterales bacterium]|nr:autotransporter outer membrane beta-barrel domain-containing protein [Desulfobacterales bacterium]
MKLFSPKYMAGLVLGFLLLLGLFPVRAGPGKAYNDISVQDFNSDAVTGYLFWKNAYGNDYYSGINLTDATAYSPDLTFTNGGNISLGALNLSTANVLSGIGNDNGDVGILNRGDIDFLYSGIGRNVSFLGIQTTGAIENQGRISISVDSGTVVGAGLLRALYVHGLRSGGASLVNSGDIQINAQSGKFSSGTVGWTQVDGIRFTGSQGVRNSGNITVLCTGWDITGSSTVTVTQATGIYTEADFHNTGKIKVTTLAGKVRNSAVDPYVSEDAIAYGVWIRGNHTFHSEGVIEVDALPSPGLTGGTHEAYQVLAQNGLVSITGYAMAVDDPATLVSDYDDVIKVNGLGSVAFTNTVLFLHVDSNFTGQGAYDIPMLVDGAATADQFSSVSGGPLDYDVSLVNGGGQALQKLKFVYAPKTSVPLLSTQAQTELNGQGHQMVAGRMMASALSDTLTQPQLSFTSHQGVEALMNSLGPDRGQMPLSRGKEGTTVFAIPMALKSETEGASGYDARSQGFLGGMTRSLSPDFHLGIHAGVSRLDVQYSGEGLDLRSEDIISYSGGLHGVYRHNEDWFFSGLASVFHARTDYRDLAADNRETASHDSLALRLDSGLGYLHPVGDQYLFPELGLSTVWNRRRAFTTDNQSGPDVTYGTMEETEVYARAGLTWFGHWKLDGGWQMVGHLGMGLTHTLSHGELSNTMTRANLVSEVRYRPDKTTLTAQAGLEFTRGEIGFNLGYSGEYADHQKSHLVWLRLGMDFDFP